MSNLEPSNIHYLSVVEKYPSLEITTEGDNPDLNDFWKKVDQEPYYIHKKNVVKYKVIFYLLGLVFIGLSLFVFFEKTSWFCSMLFTNCYFAQAALSGFCLLLSAAAFSIGFHIRAEKDAVLHLACRAKQNIAKIYAQKCPHFGYGWLLVFRGDKQAATLLKAYHDAADKLNELKNSTLILLKQVSHSKLDFSSKEHLFNQALLELKEKLNWMVHSYKA